jgi:hypothetical protein
MLFLLGEGMGVFIMSILYKQLFLNYQMHCTVI